ncbi:MAG TPA: bifunctional phosphoribosylaminoimidazolecarboxamide formyltransferase/IMP cyclohydrolase [Candidatus Baltobacteraceae bacterium]|jgi:phosphoribosylaminoimidazolecarboxamide formyltransferase/IMP cyclohydrolase|nr:bifunctional phosphoribosylaminoimidazolecarboxamide formyltransferase/IMP cyclohydrolase [Candidatus Baltobacteraceae bacterium]
MRLLLLAEVHTPTRTIALVSVSDREGLIELARALNANDVDIYATSGTRAYLTEHGVGAYDVAELTGFPALFDGRVKTLHPNVFGGILADRDNPAHLAEAQAHSVPTIGLVVVNLYPFEATVARENVKPDDALEQIDIGGVALLRAAAKNYAHVSVLVEPKQYGAFIAALPAGPDVKARRRLATRAFERTAEYDAAIVRYLESGPNFTALPDALALTLPLALPLRYGVNPQSRAAFYLEDGRNLPEQLHGKALSYNNLLDVDAILCLMARNPSEGLGLASPRHAVRAAIVKHTVPCGVAERETVFEAVHAALDTDPVSAFGGVIAVDGTVDLATAERLGEFFLEIVAAPEYTVEALKRLRKRKNLRILKYELSLPMRLAAELRVRSALGGVLAEAGDPAAKPEEWHVVTKRLPTAEQWADLRFAWDIVRHVKSNGVVVARDGITRGICAGQTNRVSAVRIAGERAGEFAHGSACASDGFFPFADGLEAAAFAGCTAVIAPEGSIRDEEVIAAADRLGIALVFSTYRYFLH